MKILINILGLFLLIYSCKSHFLNQNIFPKVRDVSNLIKTDFVPTLESSYITEKNTIYGATIPYAWNEIKNQIGLPLKGFTSKELEKLNNTKSFEDVLKENEYETSVEFIGNKIKASAFFKKSLPFEQKLKKFNKPLLFNTIEVESFGFWGNHSCATLNYFNNENDFSISLFPKNKEHEIILIMNQNESDKLSTFTELFKDFQQQKKQNVHFNDDDKVEIPIIEFNLEKTYNEFIGSEFYTKEAEYVVTKAYQRNAFVLNENGAEVESEAKFEVVATSIRFNEPEPKMMIFNKPFVVFLKRKDAKHPYFGVYIANEELLKKK